MSRGPDALEPLLAEVGLRPQGPVEILQGGEFNLVLRVPTDRGDVVVRRFDLIDAGAAGARLEFVSYLAAHGVPAPAPLRNRLGGLVTTWMGRPTAVLRHLAGRNPEDLDAVLARQAGRLLARLHALGRVWTGPLPEVDRLGRLRRALATTRPLAGWDRFAALLSGFLSSHADALGRAWRDLPSGPIHYDLHAFNILTDGDRLVGLLDFDEVHRAPLVLDPLRACYFLASRTADLRPPRAECAALFAGYESARPLTDPERAALPLLFDLVSLSDAATTLADPACSLRAVDDCDSLQIYAANAGRGLGPSVPGPPDDPE